MDSQWMHRVWGCTLLIVISVMWSLGPVEAAEKTIKYGIATPLSGPAAPWGIPHVRAAEMVFGWTAEETIGRRLLSVPEHKQHEFYALRARVMSGSPFTGFETTVVRRDGSVVDVSI